VSAHASSCDERRWRELLTRPRFEREYARLLRRLAALARFKYRLPHEDRQELAGDALLAFRQELSCRGGVRAEGTGSQPR
jgi:hypothetical protein